MSEKLKTPVMIVNFKSYKEVDGEGALRLAKICESISKENGVSIVVCPPVVELGTVARNVNIPVFSQNIDCCASGSGWVTASMVKSAGAIGTLINHSEHRFENGAIYECIKLSRANSLIATVCAESAKEAVDIAAHAPEFIAIEPPELIGGNISVAVANPHMVEDAVRKVKDVNSSISVLCGAGIKTRNDIDKALNSGADGVLIASGVVKSKDPRKILQDLTMSL